MRGATGSAMSSSKTENDPTPSTRQRPRGRIRPRTMATRAASSASHRAPRPDCSTATHRKRPRLDQPQTARAWSPRRTSRSADERVTMVTSSKGWKREPSSPACDRTRLSTPGSTRPRYRVMPRPAKASARRESRGPMSSTRVWDGSPRVIPTARPYRASTSPGVHRGGSARIRYHELPLASASISAWLRARSKTIVSSMAPSYPKLVAWPPRIRAWVLLAIAEGPGAVASRTPST